MFNHYCKYNPDQVSLNWSKGSYRTCNISPIMLTSLSRTVQSMTFLDLIRYWLLPLMLT